MKRAFRRLSSFTRLLHSRPPPRAPLALNRILASLAKAKRFPAAIFLCAQTESRARSVAPCHVTLTILINCFCHVGKVALAFSVFGKLLKRGLPYDVVTVNTLINGICLNGAVSTALKFHDEMLADGFEFNEITYGTLINGLCDAGKTKVAVRLLRMIQHCVFNVKPNVVMYSRIIEALCKEGLVNEACEWYYEMVGNNVEPTVFTFRPLVRALCVAGWLNEAVWMVEEMISKGIYVDLYVFSVLIDGLCKKGMVGEAREVFDEMIKRGCGVSVVACSSLMVGYCLKNEVDEARRLFDAVVGRPDVWSYNVLINGYCKVRRLDDAMKLFYEMWGKNVVPNLVTYNLLVDCVCKCGRVAIAWKVVKTMCESGLAPDVVTYSILLDGLCKEQHLDLAVVLFNQLIKRGVALDVWSYSILIDGCCKNQRIDLGDSLTCGSLLMRCMAMLHPWMLSITLMHFAETSILTASALLQRIVDKSLLICSRLTILTDGLVETYPGLQYLDGFPQVKVVLRADVSAATYDKVAIISGGGSGHEPAHAGFVGEGMLTAAICGDIFSSPPVDSILAGIRAVTGPKGCLLVVKNYTGDRLNFGLAAEIAKSEGYKVETVIVGDDCALPPPRGIAGRRGLAGTILVHKVAGAAAAGGLSLADVAAEAKHASEIVGTMGVALTVCTIPGQVASDRLGPGKMELGLGIHGEPGAAVADIQPVNVVVSHVLQQILSTETNYVPITRGERVVLMVNGLGGTPTMELMITAGKTVPKLQLEHGLAVDRVYTGSFMTSLDMAGFSISIMKADPVILQRLDAPTKAPYWPVAADGNHPPAKIPVPIPASRTAKTDEPRSRPQQLNEQGQILEVAIEAAANAIINLKDNLNEWDGKVGDGDCGSTMYRGAKAILEDIKDYPLNDASETVGEIGSSIGRSMGGTSGIIYTIFFKAAHSVLKASSHSGVTSKQWAEALATSIAAVSKYGGASAGYRTLLDALIPASSVLEEKLNSGDDPCTAFVLSSEAALAGAQSTVDMQAQAGRSTYISGEILSTIPDPGAMAAATWYRAAALAVKAKYQS